MSDKKEQTSRQANQGYTGRRSSDNDEAALTDVFVLALLKEYTNNNVSCSLTNIGKLLKRAKNDIDMNYCKNVDAELQDFYKSVSEGGKTKMRLITEVDSERRRVDRHIKALEAILRPSDNMSAITPIIWETLGGTIVRTGDSYYFKELPIDKFRKKREFKNDTDAVSYAEVDMGDILQSINGPLLEQIKEECKPKRPSSKAQFSRPSRS